MLDQLKKEIAAQFAPLEAGYSDWFEQSPFAECEGITPEEILSFYQSDLDECDRLFLTDLINRWGEAQVCAAASQVCARCRSYTVLFFLRDDPLGIVCRHCRRKLEEERKIRAARCQPSLF